MRRLLLTCALALALALALAATASARLYDLPATAAPTVKVIKRQTSVGVLVPARLNFDYRGKLYFSGGGTSKATTSGSRRRGGAARTRASSRR